MLPSRIHRPSPTWTAIAASVLASMVIERPRVNPALTRAAVATG
jgi:hypothetical protein